MPTSSADSPARVLGFGQVIFMSCTERIYPRTMFSTGDK
jgi:hypothetical protein